MNKKGVVWFAIPLIWQIIIAAGLFGGGLYLADTVGLFGTAAPYGACGLGSWGKPCPMGYFCDNAWFVSGSCQPVQGIGGWWDRLLGSLSLNNLLCGQAGLLAPFCNIALPLFSALIMIAIFVVLALIITPNKLAIYGAIALGLLAGLGFYSFVANFYWILIIIGLIIAIVLYTFKEEIF